MEDLKYLIEQLPESSNLGFKKFLLNYGNRKLSDKKIFQLYLLVKNTNSQISNDDLCDRLWGIQKLDSLKSLKYKLKNRLLEYLVHDHNLSNNNSIEKIHRDEIKLLKKWDQILCKYELDGFTKFIKREFERLLNSASQKEFYFLCAHILSIVVRNTWNEERNKFVKEYRKYEYYKKAVNRANELYYELIMWSEFHGKNNPTQVEKFLKNAIKEIDEYLLNTDSKVILYYHHLLKLSLHFKNDDYHSIQNENYKIIELLNSSPAVFRKERIGITLGNLSRCDIHFGMYKSAISSSLRAKQYFKEGTINNLVITENLFRAYFGAREVEKAFETLNYLKQNLKDRSDFRFSQYRFFEANLKFRKGDFRGCLAILRENLELLKDKTGWGISTRLLRIMSLTELGKTDQVSAEIETLRKHLERHGDEEVNLRDKLILRLLRIQEKAGFTFSEITPAEEKIIAQLSGNDKRYRWVPLMPELIPFHEWYQSCHTRQAIPH